MQDAHPDWMAAYERDRKRLHAAYRRQMAIVLLVVGGFLAMAVTAAALFLGRLS
ncbi:MULTISPECIES: hypothetical protein [unclassified Shinella]|uniref:hypothetical protein n=1 Tax=unclassified Shinella TaxID=2643062 RepID=UPI00234EF50E|nr:MULTISPECIES: hypothetical protein [unclassified Shinella]MCO5153355.1 hypothetical protein [Shinella sp.]MDC7260534.1 hypothetical protein [Shinella sp. HY16]MDC7267429.1 hypothetical protein [Shinella sp. YZ44]